MLNLNSVNSGYRQWQVLIDDHNLPFIIGRRCERTNNSAQKRVLLVSDECRYLDFEVEKKFALHFEKMRTLRLLIFVWHIMIRHLPHNLQPRDIPQTIEKHLAPAAE